MSTSSTSSTPAAAPAKSKLYRVIGTLASDVVSKTANTKNGERPMVLAKVAAKINGKDRTVTVSTLSAKAIAYLAGRKAGEAVKLFGTYHNGMFSAIGESTPRPTIAK